MDRIKIRASERTPEVDFDFQSNLFRIAGESYPENVAEFYAEHIEKFETHLAKLRGASIKFTFELIYFNSSSARVIMELLDVMEKAALEGNQVEIYWIHDKEDDYMREIGEEFSEDLNQAQFVLKATY